MTADVRYGSVPIDEALKLSGLDFLRAIRDGRLPHPPIAETADFRLAEVEPGHVVWEGAAKPNYLNPLGGVHGGWIATLLDSCMGCAAHTTLPAGVPYTTIDLKITYVRGVTMASGMLRAEGKVVHPGRRIVSTEGRLVDAAGKLYAHGVSTLMVLEAPKR
ncbi:MAG: PaaI family thioesterase [Alphaproteobacteria bacterium]